MKVKCKQCRGWYRNSEFYVHNGERVCRECLIFNMESIGTIKAEKIANYLKTKESN